MKRTVCFLLCLCILCPLVFAENVPGMDSFEGRISWDSTIEEVQAVEGETYIHRNDEGTQAWFWYDCEFFGYSAERQYSFAGDRLVGIIYNEIDESNLGEDNAYEPLKRALSELYGEPDETEDALEIIYSYTRAYAGSFEKPSRTAIMEQMLYGVAGWYLEDGTQALLFNSYYYPYILFVRPGLDSE